MNLYEIKESGNKGWFTQSLQNKNIENVDGYKRLISSILTDIYKCKPNKIHFPKTKNNVLAVEVLD